MLRKIITGSLLALFALTGNGQIGLGTSSPNSSLDVRGGFATAIRTFTSATTAVTTDNTLIFTGTSAASVTLPDATTCIGRNYWIKNGSTTLPVPLVTINTVSSQTIGGVATYTVEEPNEIVRLVSDGTNWQVSSSDVAARKSSTVGGAWNQGGNKMSLIKNLGAITNYDQSFIANSIEGMRVSASGFLGIGATSPMGRLHAQSENNDAGNDYIFDDYGSTITAGFFVRKHRGTIASPQNLQNGDLITQFRFSPRYNGSIANNDGSGLDAYYHGDGTTLLTDLRWFTGGIERMRMNDTGNIGIGTSAFDVNDIERLLVDAGTTGSYNVVSGKGEIDNYLQLNIKNNSSGNSASTDIVATADNGTETVNYIDMGINSSGYNNTLLPILNGTSVAYLYAIGADFVIGNGTTGSDMVFFTNAFTAANERMRISASGNVGIGTTGAPAEKLTVAGILSPSADNSYTIGSSTNRWSFVYAANGTIQTSDIRFKTNIQPLEYGTETIMQLKPVRYNWKNDPLKMRKIGLIAQEVKPLVPEVVTGDETKEHLGMNYSEIVTVLINTIKNQNQKLQQLKEQLEQLEKISQ